VITAAARRSLPALGVVQKGRSRLWFADHGWWLINIEFQPSGFSKGSYLNVGAQWLWQPTSAHAFMVGYRAGQFSGYDSDEQFAPIAVQLAQSAVDEVVKYQSLFPDVHAVAEFYRAEERATARSRRDPRNTDPYPLSPAGMYHIAVALGLCGKAEESARWFDAFVSVRDSRPWFISEQHEAERLQALLADQSAFRQAVETTIVATRVALRLPGLWDACADPTWSGR
jgi:hypothetical protein